ncbi:hypothetical protein MHYP_G00098540 [Metynnis hypsauchen]
MLNRIHESHLGEVKCKERARDILYWPGMSVQIEDFESQFAVCNANRNSNPREPLLSHSLPGRPSKIGTDLFHHNGAEYLLCVDYYSKFPEISKLSNTTAQGVILSLRSVFARHGIPDVVVSDNGPQYASAEFSNFTRDWEFKHITSSPGHAQSNGQAERTVQTIKNLLKTAQDGKGDPYIALLEYRNMPLEGIGFSPAQLLMGHRLKSKPPTSNVLLTPESKIQIQDKLERRQLKQKSYYDRQTKNLPSICTGDKGDLRQQFWRRSSKSKAPPPPPVLHGTCVSPSDPVFPHTAMEQKENLLEQELLLTVVLPEGVEKTTAVHGSKPMMDLLVMLCAKYHLNPSGHTIELVSTNRNHIKFKPNALIGAMQAEKVLLKPKGMEDKKNTGPQMPEATVRMVINYKKTQKTILRVNPRLPLQELLPVICEKCEFEPQSTVLLQNVHSEEPLDLSSSLNELGLREVYARDTRVISPASFPPSPTHSADIIEPGKDKLQKEKENKGLFGMFKRGTYLLC